MPSHANHPTGLSDLFGFRKLARASWAVARTRAVEPPERSTAQSEEAAVEIFKAWP
jgi:hypothetical protein